MYYHHQWRYSPINKPWPLLEFFCPLEDSQQIYFYRVRLSASRPTPNLEGLLGCIFIIFIVRLVNIAPSTVYTGQRATYMKLKVVRSQTCHTFTKPLETSSPVCCDSTGLRRAILGVTVRLQRQTRVGSRLGPVKVVATEHVLKCI
jgi:hypothetical protein